MKLAAVLSVLLLAGMRHQKSKHCIYHIIYIIVVGSPSDREGSEKSESQVVKSEGCLEPADCPGMQQYCDLEDGQCKFGCDEQEDCPEGEFCIYVNHMCQC